MLVPYQRDALRLIIRDLHRPERIPKAIWSELMFGEAKKISKAHLKEIAKLAPHVYNILRFWKHTDAR
jgi:hypothetical protein